MPDEPTVTPCDIPRSCERDGAQKRSSDSSSDKDERVLVTFAIFAYNQESYIREAIEAAFSQTYEPLEIILSDDCSTDRTFEIMQEMAGSYRGTKKVLARQTHCNMGTLLHVADVAKIANGRLFILAAGDDVSKKERAEKIYGEWLSTNAWGFYSKFDRIDERGELISESVDPRKFFPPEYRLRHYFANPYPKVEIIHGATSAYDMKVFEFLDVRPTDYILSEDGVLSVLLNILGKEIRMIDMSLVGYRENEQSVTNSVKNRKISREIVLNDESKIERFLRSHVNRLELFIRWGGKYGAKYRRLDIEQMVGDLSKLKMRENWWRASLLERLEYLKNNLNSTEIKWALPRILPKSFFLLTKTLIKKFL